jgi:hypothetical protein
MLRDEAYVAWTDQHPRVLRESERLIGPLLAGAQIGASPRKRKAAWGGGARSPTAGF